MLKLEATVAGTTLTISLSPDTAADDSLNVG